MSREKNEQMETDYFWKFHIKMLMTLIRLMILMIIIKREVVMIAIIL